MRSRKPSGQGAARKAATPAETPTDSQTPQKAARGGARMQMQGRIGTQLKAVYDEMLNAPIPDRFVELLDKLERGEKSE